MRNAYTNVHMATLLAAPTYIGDLGNGLIRRWSSRGDEPGIAHLMGSVFRSGPDEPFNPRRADVARILMSEEFPYMGPGDFAIVEDTGYSGDLKVDFYRGGLRLQFAQGRLTLAESWQAPAYGNDAQCLRTLRGAR